MKTQHFYIDLTQRPPRSFRVRLGNYDRAGRLRCSYQFYPGPFAPDRYRRPGFAFGARKLLRFDLHAQGSWPKCLSLGQPGKEHPDRGHMLLNSCRRARVLCKKAPPPIPTRPEIPPIKRPSNNPPNAALNDMAGVLAHSHRSTRVFISERYFVDVGSPCAYQAVIPPAVFRIWGNPVRCRMLQPMLDRYPLPHMTWRGTATGSSWRRSDSSPNGM
jgi:hypothetical protein